MNVSPESVLISSLPPSICCPAYLGHIERCAVPPSDLDGEGVTEGDVDEDGASAGHGSGGGAEGHHGAAAAAPPTLHTRDGLRMLRLLRVLFALSHIQYHFSQDTDGCRSHTWCVGKEGRAAPHSSGRGASSRKVTRGTTIVQAVLLSG